MPQAFITCPTVGDPATMLREAGIDVTVHREPEPITYDQIAEQAAGCHGLLTQLVDRVDAALMDAIGTQLKAISQYAVGTDNIDLDAANQRGIAVCNTPDVLSDATADLGWALLMAVARRVVEGDRFVRSGEWDGWNPTRLLGTDLTGKTLAIIGAGRIGTAFARRSTGWNMPLLYVARSAKPAMDALGAEHVDLATALRKADFVSLHCPLTERTHHLIGEPELKLMKPTAYLINTARGPVVDEKALLAALQDRRIAGAGLDVFEDEPRLTAGLDECDNAVLLPHLGSAAVETRTEMTRLAAANLAAVLKGESPEALVNPQVMAKSS